MSVVSESTCAGCAGEQNSTDMLDDAQQQQQRYTVLTFWDSQVAVVGIGLCTSVILASVSFVCHQRLGLRRMRAKQDTQTPAYRALVASKHKQSDVTAPAVQQQQHGNNDAMMTKRLEPRSAGVTATECPSSHTTPTAAQRTGAVKLCSSSPRRDHHQLTPSSARTHRHPHCTSSPLTSTRAAAQQLSIFQPTHDDPPAALRSSRTRSRSPKEVFECVCLTSRPDRDTVMLETRPPVEGQDSLSIEQVLDTALSPGSELNTAAAELKTASYVPPTQCSVAVRRSLERVEEPTQVTRGTSPMSTSDVDVLPDISGLLTSGTETDDINDDVMTMTGARSWSSLSDLVAGGCDDSDDFTGRPHTASTDANQQRLYRAAAWPPRKSSWTARRHQRDGVLESDVYYC